MKEMGLHEVRKAFLDFFSSKEHLVEKSFSLVPHNDKSLLLIGAGMAPLKKYFTGEVTPPNKRMATCQKCIRTGDIENVGITARHATFFEMLGNFSFGDYFKNEAINWAWEFLTEHLELDPKRLWVSVYLDDDEAHDVWRDKIGVPEERIVRLGKEDNFWELEVGPSGPCSEIYYDRGEEYGTGSENEAPGGEGDRFIEIWNLVFTQFDKDELGTYNPLKHPNIDTGMGLERITCVMEGVNTIFDIRAIREIIEAIENKANVKYGSDDKKDISIRVITDHLRAMTFMTSDGILPSNEGRGYVLRRIIRRAIRHGKLLGIEGSFLADIVEIVINSWRVEYNNLEEQREKILKIIKAEEEKFTETLSQGLDILKEYIEEERMNNSTVLSGEKSFKLYDTFGFPIDLTIEILQEEGMTLDKEGFDHHMERQREMARGSREVDNIGWESLKIDETIQELTTKFSGYLKIFEESKVLSIMKDNDTVTSLKAGEEGIIFMESSPFYAEGGGQVGDTGSISSDNFKGKVLDTQRQNDIIMHIVEIEEGELKKGDEISLAIDYERRNLIKNNHSATHLMHKALKEVLGEHVNQAGSVVSSERLRFDFTHPSPMTDEEIRRVEDIVNKEIFKKTPVITMEMSYDDAMTRGAVGLFEDKYKSWVRVVEMGDFSIELCGGTHVDNTSEIGIFKIIHESGVALGVRRIEAITSKAVYEYLNAKEDLIESLTSRFKTNEDQLLNKAVQIQEELKEKDRELEKFKQAFAKEKSKELTDGAEDISGILTLVKLVDSINMEELRNLGDEIKSRLKSCAIVLGTVYEEKPYLLAMAADDAVKKGFHAGILIKETAKIIGGGGGGRPNMAQAGGKDPSNMQEALKRAKEIIKEQLKG